MHWWGRIRSSLIQGGVTVSGNCRATSSKLSIPLKTLSLFSKPINPYSKSLQGRYHQNLCQRLLSSLPPPSPVSFLSSSSFPVRYPSFFTFFLYFWDPYHRRSDRRIWPSPRCHCHRSIWLPHRRIPTFSCPLRNANRPSVWLEKRIRERESERRINYGWTDSILLFWV